HDMFSYSAVTNDRSRVASAVATSRGFAPRGFYFSGRDMQFHKEFDLAATASHRVASSTLPEMWAAPDREEEPLHRLLRDEVESVNRLHRVISQIGYDILFYSETGELAGYFGKPLREADCLPDLVSRPEAQPSLLAPIFNADGRFVGSLGLSSAEGECTGTVAALMQMLVRMTAHAVEERAFRTRYPREWIVALVPPDGAASCVLLAVDGDHRVIGSDRHARTTLLHGESDAPAVLLWALFEKDATIFRYPEWGDRPVVLTGVGTAEPWSALITPPAPDPSRAPANADLHARPRLDLLGWSGTPPTSIRARGGLPPRALGRVRDYIDAHLAGNIGLDALADVA